MAGDVPSLAPPACAPGPVVVPPETARLAAAAASYADASQAPATRRAYDSSWWMFATWCDDHQAIALPASPDVVALYLTFVAQAGRRVATMARILAAIGDRHRRADLAPPASARLTGIWSGIRRAERAPQRQVRALVTADLRKVVARLPAGTAGQRDKALLVLAFSGALRRSELVSLELDTGRRIVATSSVAFVPGGLRISLGRSKTDQEGRGQIIAIPRGRTKLCPVAALREWLDLSGISDGPIFREVDRHGRVGATALSDRAFADVVKRAVARTGMAPDLFSGHSCRAGFVTEAAAKGATLEQIMRQTRHKKPETVLLYMREADLFSNNAAGKIGL